MLRVDAFSPSPRRGIENPCVGGSIPPRATNFEAPLFLQVGLFSWANGYATGRQFGVRFGCMRLVVGLPIRFEQAISDADI